MASPILACVLLYVIVFANVKFAFAAPQLSKNKAPTDVQLLQDTETVINQASQRLEKQDERFYERYDTLMGRAIWAFATVFGLAWIMVALFVRFGLKSLRTHAEKFAEDYFKHSIDRVTAKFEDKLLKKSEELEKTDKKERLNLIATRINIYRLLHKWEDAKYLFNHGIRTDPSFPYFYIVMAQTLRDEGIFDYKKSAQKQKKYDLLNQALGHCNRAIQIDFNLAVAYMVRASITYCLDKSQEAKVTADLEHAKSLKRDLVPFFRLEEGFKVEKGEEEPPFLKKLEEK